MPELINGQFGNWSHEEARRRSLEQAAKRAGQMQGFMGQPVEVRPEFDYAQQANDTGIKANTIMQESAINAGNNSIVQNVNDAIAQQQASAQAALDAQAAALAASTGSEAPQPHQISAYMRALRKVSKTPPTDLPERGLEEPFGRYGLSEEVLSNSNGGDRGGWDRQALGRDITPEQYLNSKKLQNQISRYQFGKYLQKAGNAEGALTKWHEKTNNPLSLETFLSQVLSQLR